MKLDIDGKELITDSTWKSYLAGCWKPGHYKRWFLRSLQENFDARLYPVHWNTPTFSENSEWIAAGELRGAANKSSDSNGYSNYLMDISAKVELQLREWSIPLMNENNMAVKKLTEAFRIDWKLPSENYFDMKVPDAFHASPMLPLPAYENNTLTIPPDGNKEVALTIEFAVQSVGFPYFTIDSPEGTTIEMLVHEAHQPGDVVLINTHFHSKSTGYPRNQGTLA